ncbi:MAG: TolC family protein [Rikenellaceae bacterium]
MLRKVSKIINIVVVAATVLLLGVQTTSAQALTLEQCRQMALDSNYKLKSSSEKILASEDLLKAYKTNNLPNFSLGGNYLYSSMSYSLAMAGGYLPIFTNGVMSSDTFAYMPDQNYELEVGSVFNVSAMATQPIYMGGQVSNAIKLARVGVKVSNLERQLSQTEVLELVDNAFYKVVELEELLLSAQKYEAVVEEFHTQMESAYNRGMKTRNDLLKVGVRLSEAKLMTQKATNGLRLATMNLCYTIGLPLSTAEVSLSSSNIEQGQQINDNSLDVTSRPEYAMLEEQIIAKELEVKITRGGYLPSLSAVASYGYANGVKINGATALNGTSFMGGVSLNVPIFHWGEGRRKTSAKQREVTMAQNQMADMKQLMSLELLQAINTYNESLLEVSLAQESVTQAEENMRLSKSHYDAGMETIADYLESQALWQKAMSDLCAARAGQRTSYTSYLKCRGELLVVE